MASLASVVVTDVLNLSSRTESRPAHLPQSFTVVLTPVRGGRTWAYGKERERMLITVEYKVLAISAFVVAAILIWDRIHIGKRTRWIETQLRKTEKKVYILEMQESGRLMRLVRELSGKSRVKIDSRGTAEIAVGNVAWRRTSASSMAVRRECANHQNRRRSSRHLLLSKPVPERNAFEEQSSADQGSPSRKIPPIGKDVENRSPADDAKVT